MSDVKVTIGADNSALNSALVDAKNRVENFGRVLEGTGGARGEMRMARGLKSLAVELSKAQSPMDALLIAAEKLGHAFHVAGTAVIGLMAGLALKEQLEKAAESANGFFEAIGKSLGTNLKEASEEKIGELKKDLEKEEERYANRGWLEKVIFGKDEDKLITTARSQIAEIKKVLDQKEAEKINKKVDILRAGSEEEKAQREISLIDSEYGDKRRKALEDGNVETEQALQREQFARRSETLQKLTEFQKKEEDKRSEEAKKKSKEVSDYEEKISKQKEKQGDIQVSMKMELSTLTQQLSILDGRIKAESILASSGKDRLTTEEHRTKELEFQNEKLKKQKELDDKRAKISEREIDLKFRAAEEEDKLSREAFSTPFKGGVSSLAAIGGGGGIGTQNTQAEQLNKMREQSQTLKDIKAQLEKLNSEAAAL